MPYDATDESTDFAPIVPTMPRSNTRTDGGSRGRFQRRADESPAEPRRRTVSDLVTEADAPLVLDLCC